MMMNLGQFQKKKVLQKNVQALLKRRKRKNRKKKKIKEMKDVSQNEGDDVSKKRGGNGMFKKKKKKGHASGTLHG